MNLPGAIDSPIEEEMTFIVSVDDPEGFGYYFLDAELPEGAEFDGQQFSWRPTEEQSGVYYVEFKITSLGYRNYEGSSARVMVTVGSYGGPQEAMLIDLPEAEPIAVKRAKGTIKKTGALKKLHKPYIPRRSFLWRFLVKKFKDSLPDHYRRLLFKR